MGKGIPHMATGTRRSRKVHAVDRGCLTGYGKTAAEAKADLNQKIDRAVDGGYSPFMVSYGSYSALCHREPHGWSYILLDPARIETVTRPGVRSLFGSSGYYDTRKACEDMAAFHVLDLGSGPEEFHSDLDIPEWLTDPARRDTLLGNARFRRAWLWAKENAPDGIDPEDSNQLHRWGCEHSRDPQFA
jgi:hypothetical protein